MSHCIFCNSTEPNSHNLLVCGDCVAKFSGKSITAIKAFAGDHALTPPQLKFLHVPKEPEQKEKR